MMPVGRPIRDVAFVSLIPPHSPARTLTTSKEFKERSWAARLDQFVLFVRLATVLALPSADVVDLGSAGLKCARVLPANAEEQ